MSKRNTVKYPCGECGQSCHLTNCLFCGICKAWQHMECQNMPKEEFEKWSSVSEDYICLRCVCRDGNFDFEAGLARMEQFYGENEARKYTSNSRMIEIQEQLSQRAVELLALPDDVPCFILDIGCGSGLSGECLTDQGHEWIGIDISSHMLDVATEREVEGDLLLGDMGSGMPFRPGTFDGAMSISALQWLCNADKKHHSPPKRLYKFFSTLYAALSRGAKAVFQLYPENSAQLELITQQAMKAGFTGGLVVDFPNSTKAKKIFLCLFTGGTNQQLPKALGTETNKNQVTYSDKRERIKNARGKSLKKSRDWILEKKERRRRQGKETRRDTKYTGRKRKSVF